MGSIVVVLWSQNNVAEPVACSTRVANGSMQASNVVLMSTDRVTSVRVQQQQQSSDTASRKRSPQNKDTWFNMPNQYRTPSAPMQLLI